MKMSSYIHLVSYWKPETTLFAELDGTVSLREQNSLNTMKPPLWSFSSGPSICSSYQAPVNYNNNNEVSSNIGNGYFIDCGRGDDWELLKAHFQDNPKDLDLLKHDKMLSKKAPAPHLCDVHDYLLDPTTQEARKIVKLARVAMDNTNPSRGKGSKKRFKEVVKAYTEGQQKERFKIKELVPRVLKQIQNQVSKFEDLLKDDGSPNIESIKRLFRKFDDNHNSYLTPSELEKLTENVNFREGNTEKIDVCIDDETVNYLNRQDVRRALHARLVGVHSWDVCSIDTDHIYSRIACQGENSSLNLQPSDAVSGPISPMDARRTRDDNDPNDIL
ncbi:hypothetical protein T459_27428 [Capsicum annuum]|uniref:EF-hand domain-containing protein n=1 Tax=Capsicum annuum TaxID=4072 RepID=A0A2G2YEE8_CAPAN|nr:hypothetical protein T459_27428 [Capsicum annuum]